METIKDYLHNLKSGEVVGKRGLCYFKRKGYIWDYSCFGYLESLHIWGKKRDGEYFRDEFWLEVSRDGNCHLAEQFAGEDGKKRMYSSVRSDKTHDELRELFGPQGSFEFDGMTFGPKYFDGCFCPYLVKR